MDQPARVDPAQRSFSMRTAADPEATTLLRNVTFAARIDRAFLLVIVVDMTVKPFA